MLQYPDHTLNCTFLIQYFSQSSPTWSDSLNWRRFNVFSMLVALTAPAYWTMHTLWGSRALRVASRSWYLTD
ncbi:hypothetical protein BDZ94DRAFT_1278059 [Collybia nuda]|uniref:Uncharacterized protein n=1 Tax=Collybia nuda TaxID=64659 RepID=A0A9P5XRM9_9AGAR|nr:hypothetical protein BDZ94DRAFT_1278059 [Collybia nuda]